MAQCQPCFFFIHQILLASAVNLKGKHGFPDAGRERCLCDVTCQWALLHPFKLMALSSVHPRLPSSTQTFIYLFRWWQHQRAARLSKKHHRGKSQGHMSVKRRSTGRLCEQMCTHTRMPLCACEFVWMCVKLLDSWVKETWCEFTQSPRRFAFKAWGLAEYTTAGGTVKGQSSGWLSFPQLTYGWPWQANPNIEKKTYVKTICRRRKGRMWGPC